MTSMHTSLWPRRKNLDILTVLIGTINSNATNDISTNFYANRYMQPIDTTGSTPSQMAVLVQHSNHHPIPFPNNLVHKITGLPNCMVDITCFLTLFNNFMPSNPSIMVTWLPNQKILVGNPIKTIAWLLQLHSK